MLKTVQLNSNVPGFESDQAIIVLVHSNKNAGEAVYQADGGSPIA
jgi:hypothetical protein